VSTDDPLDVAQYTLDELKAAVEAADDWSTDVTAHASTPKAMRRAVEAGIKSIEHGPLAVRMAGEYFFERCPHTR
jgi:imidazolonepropionase-like amidohydrolase